MQYSTSEDDSRIFTTFSLTDSSPKDYLILVWSPYQSFSYGLDLIKWSLKSVEIINFYTFQRSLIPSLPRIHIFFKGILIHSIMYGGWVIQWMVICIFMKYSYIVIYEKVLKKPCKCPHLHKACVFRPTKEFNLWIIGVLLCCSALLGGLNGLKDYSLFIRYE